jgi:hypothetical protein
MHAYVYVFVYTLTPRVLPFVLAAKNRPGCCCCRLLPLPLLAAMLLLIMYPLLRRWY